ncbi:MULTISPECIES: hypothetical protein [unclassified Viridibacillus]
MRSSTEPLTGRAHGGITNVTRQVIVSDITLLKAKNDPL